MYRNRTHGPGNQAKTTLDGPGTDKNKKSKKNDLWRSKLETNPLFWSKRNVKREDNFGR